MPTVIIAIQYCFGGFSKWNKKQNLMGDINFGKRALSLSLSLSLYIYIYIYIYIYTHTHTDDVILYLGNPGESNYYTTRMSGISVQIKFTQFKLKPLEILIWKWIHC